MTRSGLQPADLRRRTIVSGVVVLAVRACQAGVSLGTAVALARLLTPADFGVFAMVVPLGIVATGLSGRCFQLAMLQRGALTDHDVNAFFWFAVRVNLVVAAGMLVAGVALSRFFGEPRVVGVTAMWASLVFLLTLTTFQEALIKRQMRFPQVMLVQFVALVFGASAAVASAWRGAGYWSLPIQLLIVEVTRGLGVFALSTWRPATASDAGSGTLAEMRQSWRALGGLHVATWLNDQPDRLAIGRLGGAPVLGYYDTARRWSWYPFDEPFFALTDLAVASLSRVHHDTERFKRAATRAILTILTVSMPGIAFVGVATESFVNVLLGSQWSPAIPFMRVLCVMAFVGSLARVSQWIHLSRGHAGWLVRWSLYVQTPVVALAVLIGCRWGALGVTIAMSLALAALALPAVAFAVRGSPIAFRDALRVASRPALASLAAAVVLGTATVEIPGAPDAGRLVLSFAVFAAVFVTVWLAIPGGVENARALALDFRAFRRAAADPDPAP